MLDVGIGHVPTVRTEPIEPLVQAVLELRHRVMHQ